MSTYKTESGEVGIRTLGRLASTPVFQTGPIGRSGTSPHARHYYRSCRPLQEDSLSEEFSGTVAVCRAGTAPLAARVGAGARRRHVGSPWHFRFSFASTAAFLYSFY